MRRGQQGLTLIGFVMVLVVAGCVAYIAMRVVPMYLEYMQVKEFDEKHRPDIVQFLERLRLGPPRRATSR